jgi:large subunit ribosomal protein L25
MEQARLKGQMREGRGKGAARAARRAGQIPAIVYGHGLPSEAIQLPERALRNFLGSGVENVIINMELGKDEAETVMLKEVQIHPVSRRLVHADFIRVSLEERLIARVPIVAIGISIGVTEGGVQEFLLRELQVECRVVDIPERIEVDVSLLEVGDQIRVGDIKLTEEMNILDDPSIMVITIAAPTIIKEVEEEEIAVDEEEEDMEPEVIGEKPAEEEEEEEEEKKDKKKKKKEE